MAAQEVIDLENDHHQEKEYMLETIRNLSKEVQVYQNVISKLVTPEQMEQILALAESRQIHEWPAEPPPEERGLARQEVSSSMLNSRGFKVRKFKTVENAQRKLNKTGSYFRRK